MRTNSYWYHLKIIITQQLTIFEFNPFPLGVMLYVFVLVAIMAKHHDRLFPVIFLLPIRDTSYISVGNILHQMYLISFCGRTKLSVVKLGNINACKDFTPGSISKDSSGWGSRKNGCLIKVSVNCWTTQQHTEKKSIHLMRIFWSGINNCRNKSLQSALRLGLGKLSDY